MKLGATGTFPDGKCSATDEGSLRTAIFADHQKNLVVLQFGKDISWLALPPEKAVEFAAALQMKAMELFLAEESRVAAKLQEEEKKQ